MLIDHIPVTLDVVDLINLAGCVKLLSSITFVNLHKVKRPCLGAYIIHISQLTSSEKLNQPLIERDNEIPLPAARLTM